MARSFHPRRRDWTRLLPCSLITTRAFPAGQNITWSRLLAGLNRHPVPLDIKMYRCSMSGPIGMMMVFAATESATTFSITSRSRFIEPY